MHGRSTRHHSPVTVAPADPRGLTPLRRSGAVTWIDAHHALVAHTTPIGADVVEIRPSAGGELASTYLTRIVDEIGDRERVLVMGPDAYRIRLEREYVAINRRPDRLLDSEVPEECCEGELLARLDALISE